MFDPKKSFLHEARFAVDVDEHPVGVVGGQDAAARHLDPAEAELVPFGGSPQGAEDDVVVDDVGGVALVVALEEAEDAEG